ncbi:Mitogen-activated protein kinase 4 [Diplonema papillatum]|nr:Mitogen-activated protein kinase 4 [Diplonema papillatum]KAJ9462281.1 Mitogen-activated protein kinase 4 [Diplonema papillatum]
MGNKIDLQANPFKIVVSGSHVGVRGGRKMPEPPSGRGRRNFTIHGTLFELPTRYEMHKAADHDGGRAVGYGTYGAVALSFDRWLRQKVLVKKLGLPPGAGSRDRGVLAVLAKELRLLARCAQCNVIRPLDAFSATKHAKGGANALYLTVPCYETTLQSIIASEQQLDDPHIRLIAFQILEGLAYLHECGVLVTRLSPSSILCNVDCGLCIADLGCCIPADVPHNAQYLAPETDSFKPACNWYKAPEHLLKAPGLTPACDVWSAGVVLMELHTRRPVFPGVDVLKQISLIADVLGVDRAGTSPVTAAEVASMREETVRPTTLWRFLRRVT